MRVGFRTSVLNPTYDYTDSEVVSSSYTPQLTLDTLSGLEPYISNTAYDSAGRMIARSLGNGVTQTHTYHPWSTDGGRLAGISAGTVQNLGYTYDDGGNILSIVDAIAGPQTQAFGYDSLNRLTSADAVGGLDGLYADTYGYDGNTGNLAAKAGLTYTYGDSAHPHAVTGLSDGSMYTYDTNGSMISRTRNGVTTTFTYNAENKLVQVQEGGNTIAQFSYDGDGNRVQSTINGVTTQFVGEYYEISGTDVTKYYGGQTATRVNGNVSYLLADHLGSNALILDSVGNVVGETRYKAWGEPRYISGATSDYTYTGQYSNTSDFGWMYFRARWYDPLLGRFNQADTIVPNPWDAASFDRYAYVKNNPIRFTDPSGHDVDCGIGDQYCNELIHEKADSSWPKQLPFRTYLKAKDSYEFFNINREEAIQADIDGDEDYMYATIYSEYVKLEWYYPYGLDVVLPEIDRAIVENDTEKYFALAGSLAILSIFDSDKGFGGGPGSESSSWSFGSFKSALKWQNQMKARGWTEQEITEALVSGQKIPALNKVNPGNTATRYVHPVNGKSVVLDDQTHEILHIGGINYEY